ncbi:uncharacterized protein LOC141695465 [Apium graveolens]|uniref:uncharacterized protein LOC141695465 n=1 Tax=Apium graveolens TaxID=4045 RepID=UPI003D78CC20
MLKAFFTSHKKSDVFLAGPRKCELVVGTIENKVAFGLLFDDDDMNKSIHRLPMQPGCARVSVDGPIQGQAKIPVPVVGEIETVEQAIGSYVSWPRDLIIFPDAPATAKSKRKGKDPLTDLHKVQSLFENMEINKNVLKRFRYLHCMVCENENLEQFAFCDPGVSFTLNINFEDNLVSRFKEGNLDRLFFMPHNSNCHWILVVIWAGEDFILNPLPRSTTFPRVGKSNIKAGRGNKAPTIRYITGCPKQPGGTECGYVVMWYMKKITMDNEMTFVKFGRQRIER